MPMHLTPYNSPSPEPVESHLNDPVDHTASTSNLSSASSHQPADTSSSEIPNLADQFSAIPESSISSSKKRPAEEEAGPDESAKRQKTEAGSKVPDLPSFLNELHRQGLGNDLLYKHLEVPDLVSMNQVSRPMHDAIQQGTILPNLQGRRTVNDPSNPAAGKQHFYSTETAGTANRYFKPTSAAGETSNLPHISEQDRYPPHITDVVGDKQYNKSGQLAAGTYPAKAQFSLTPNPDGTKTAGPIDVPSKLKDGRVFTPAPSGTQRKTGQTNPDGSEKLEPLPTGTYIEAKAYNGAVKNGFIGQGAQRVSFTDEQKNQTEQEVRARWEGKTVSGKDK